MSNAPHDEGRRHEDRLEVRWLVDCASEDTFLFAVITNVSSLGLFVRTDEPLDVGTRVRLCFAPRGIAPFQLDGIVAWVNAQPPEKSPNPGMGVRFTGLAPADRE
ncbi:MAG: TIGR02266 family protein, partial [Polyangiales bacterium]